MNALRATSLTSSVSVAGGSVPLNPGDIRISGPPGSQAILDVCGFNTAAAGSGKPYDCCRARLSVTIPNGVCQ
jgi:hypothetical protein